MLQAGSRTGISKLRQILIASLAILGIWATFGTGIVAAAPSSPSKDELGRYIVVLKDSVVHPGERASVQTEERDGKLGFVYSQAFNGYSAELPKATVEGLRKNPSVVAVEPDLRGGVASQITPTGIDRIFASTNPTLDIDEEDDQRIDADVAIIDSGIDAEHVDLDVVSQVNCSGGPPCVGGGGDGLGHGTHVAGTVGAIDNGYGVVGVAPGARLWSVKVLDSKGEGLLSEYIAGIEWVTANANQIEVANSSLRYWSHTSSEAFDKAIKGSLDAGVVHVIAAGNESETVKYTPGNHPDVITVSALEDYDGLVDEGEDPLAWFSNFGSVVDVAAPGVGIFSTIPGNEYAAKSGTSMASPHVAGVAAILASWFNPESREGVEAIRNKIVEEGNLDWVDTSGDGVQEPLLDLTLRPWAVTWGATELKATSATLIGYINPMGSATTYQFEYGKTTAYGTKVPISPKSIGSGGEFVEVNEIAEDLSPGTTYHYRLVASSESGTANGVDKTLTTTKAPSATTESATAIKSNEATLNATINPNGLATTYQFEYGPTTSYGTKIPISPKSIGSGTSPVAVSETPTGLSPGTTYHYRVVASNEVNTTNGADKTLTTTPKAPSVTTEAATSVKFDRATLNGTVNPNGATTTYQFEYGPTTSYGTKIPISPKEIGSGTSAVEVAETPTGLSAETTYHYRVVASNEVNTTNGADKTLTTSKAPSAPSFAGSFGSYGSGDGQFNLPVGIASDPEGNLWVTDATNNRVQEFNSEGEYLSKFGTKGTGNGQFSGPEAIAVGPDYHVWVADSTASRVQKFNSEGEYLSKFGTNGTGAGQFSSPIGGIAVSSESHVWVADTTNNRVQEFTAQGEYLSQFGTEGSGNGQFSDPAGIALGPDGHIWVVDSSNYRVQEFTAAGEYLSQFGTKGTGAGQFEVPWAITIDSTGSLWVTDLLNNRVQEFNSAGEYLSQFGTEGSGAGQFSFPTAVASDPEGNLWVADLYNNRIQKWVRE